METADEILRAALDLLGVPSGLRKDFDARYQGDTLTIRVPAGERIVFPATARVETGGIAGAVARELKHRGFGVPAPPK